MSGPYDEIYSKTILKGFYVHFEMSKWFPGEEVAYKIFPVSVQRIEAEVHTSHSYDVVETFLMPESREEHPELSEIRRDIKWNFHTSRMQAVIQAENVLEKRREKVQGIMKELGLD